MTNRRIDVKVPFITRVEGEASLELTAKGDKIENIRLKIIEPPRFFERLVVGRSFHDVPELSARICGICPLAYQLTSILAFERLFGIDLPQPLKQLRRVFNLAEWIQSHALHIHFLALPDFLGFNNALDMAKAHKAEFERGVRIQGFGNQVMAMLGGRSVHPIGLKVGGFGKLPEAGKLKELGEKAKETRILAAELVRFCGKLNRPDFSHSFNYVSLKSGLDYPINSGNIVGACDLDISQKAYPDYFKEHQEPHSTALYYLLKGQDYLVGPLARYNNNREYLDEGTKALAKDAGLEGESLNMFDSILIRALEIHYACGEIERLLREYSPPDSASVEFTAKAGWTCAVTEAPRGLIYHAYKVNERAEIESCAIIPPTSQNQARIEADLRASVESFGLHHSDEALKQFCEQVIRNYDPCISCSTHFLNLTLNRKPL
ncbi:nickel-dependent hydrogenase large subunit [Vibrio sp. JC009]|uniref:Ni/Fe hydrogenase subunit alpha n=1 Tax=Vibrio sp. JC009 TaxID=2912314 RepID=UPI0023B0FAF9|nr:nickel-dependent hydrogenase large subunit [Vibrio sp. JC009]WED24359.1 nickel-dependent hydrogenase large subunit [Vibrio sp. JC009]